MRIRLIEATIESLARDGYVGASLNSIAKTASVSRGAQSHHFPSKQDLLHAVVDHIAKLIRAELQDVLKGTTADAKGWGIAQLLWRRLFSGSLFQAYLELLIASQRDPVLQALLHEALSTPLEEGFWSDDDRSAVVDSLLYLSGVGLHARWIRCPEGILDKVPFSTAGPGQAIRQQ